MMVVRLLWIFSVVAVTLGLFSCEPTVSSNPYYTSGSGDEGENDSSDESGDGGDSSGGGLSGEESNGGDEDYDGGDSYDDQTITATSIAALKSLYKGSTTRVTAALSISGMVVANDVRGEFADVIVIDDGYDAIQIYVSNDPLYYNYPLGYTVVCQCDDLYLGSDYGVLRLGAAPSSADEVVSVVEDDLLRKIYLSGEVAAPTPTVVKIEELTDRMVSRFLRFESLMFKESGGNFCDVDPDSGRNLSTSHTLVDRWGNELTLYVPSTVEYGDLETPSGWFNINVILESGSAPYKVRLIDCGIDQ